VLSPLQRLVLFATPQIGRYMGHLVAILTNYDKLISLLGVTILSIAISCWDANKVVLL
jgi:hypothetical protein